MLSRDKIPLLVSASQGARRVTASAIQPKLEQPLAASSTADPRVPARRWQKELGVSSFTFNWSCRLKPKNWFLWESRKDNRIA